MGIKDLCLNLFNKPNFSDRGLISFGNFYYRMMEINNGTDIYTIRMASFHPFLVAFRQIKSDIYSSVSTRKGQTLAVEIFLDDFLDAVREQERLVNYVALGTHTPMYLEIFPEGLTGFNNLTRDKVSISLNNLIDKGDKYAVQLGANFKTVFENLKTQFSQFRDDQLDTIGEIATKISDKHAIREDFTVELSKQYLTFCAENLDNQEKVLSFFRFSIFTIHKHHHKEYEEIKAEVDANQTLMLSDAMKFTDKLEIISLTDHAITFCGGNDGETSCTRGIEVPARATVKVDYSTIANNGDLFLKVTNPDLVNSAKFTVRIYP